jgi:hypothetical protein
MDAVSEPDYDGRSEVGLDVPHAVRLDAHLLPTL